MEIKLIEVRDRGTFICFGDAVENFLRSDPGDFLG